MDLTYRKITEADIPDLITMVDCPFVQDLTLFQNAKNDGRSLNKVFNDLVKENEQLVFHSFIVFSDNQPVAFLNRVMTDQKPGYLIVGGWVDKDHRGQSIFGESLKMLMDDLKKEYPDRDFYAVAKKSNTPSIHTLKKIGFRTVGEITGNPPKIEFVYP